MALNAMRIGTRSLRALAASETEALMLRMHLKGWIKREKLKNGIAGPRVGFLVGGNYKSENTDDRFKAKWKVGEDVIVGKCNNGKSTGTESLKNTKNTRWVKL